jgi:large subunit ribosomal protein L30
VADQAQKTIHIKYVRSGIGFDFHTKTMIRSLGLNRLNQVVERQNTPQIRGLVARIPHFVEIVKPEAAPAWTLTPEHTIFPPEPKPERVKPSKPAASRDAEVKHDDASASPKAERHEKKEEKATGAKHKKAAKHDAPAKHAAHAGKEKGKAAKTEAPKKKAKAADAKHATHDKKGKK